MKKLYVAALLFGLLLALGTTASAGLLTTYTHSYGNGTGQFDPGGNDVLSNGYVTVSDQSTQRFNDFFDFSGLSYSSIDYFDLTLTYSNVGQYSFLNWVEIWYARPGGTPDQYTSFRLNPTTNTVSQTFVVGSSLVPEFANMLAAENFFFWFAEDSLGNDNFKLYSAVLDIYGQAPVQTPVPEPATMLLLGSALVGMAAFRRKFRKA